MNVDVRFDMGVLQHLEQTVGSRMLAGIIDEFVGHMPGKVTTVRQSERAGDLDTAAAALHAIISSAGMLGATKLQGLAEKMHALAAGGDQVALAALLGDLEAEYRHAEELLRGARERLAP